MNLSKRLIKALRNAEHDNTEDMSLETVVELRDLGLIKITGYSIAGDITYMAITDTGKQELKQWAEKNELKI